MDQVREAGVDFDPNARGIKSVQGDASSGSALEVSLLLLFAMKLIPLFSHTHIPPYKEDTYIIHFTGSVLFAGIMRNPFASF